MAHACPTLCERAAAAGDYAAFVAMFRRARAEQTERLGRD